MSDGTMPSTRRISRNGDPSQLSSVSCVSTSGTGTSVCAATVCNTRICNSRSYSGNTGNRCDASGARRATKRSGCPSGGWMVNSSVSLDIPLPSGAVTSVTVAPVARLAFHQAAMRSAIAAGSLRHGVERTGSSVVINSPGWLTGVSCGRQSGTSVGSALMRRVLGVVVAALAVAGLASACLPPPPPQQPPVLGAACAHTLIGSTPGIVVSDAIREASGIAASRRVDNVWWVHNDSGDTARVFAISTAGATLGEYALSGASAPDWEDIAIGPGPDAGVSYLYVGDIGDNTKSRSTVQVYRVPEPLVNPAAPLSTPQTLTGVVALDLKYPDGAHDAEALFVDPTTRDLFVVTKDLAGGVAGVYRAPAPVEGSTITLSKVATVALGGLQGVTAADITAAGDVIALRTYLGVFLYPRASGTTIAQAFAQSSCVGAAPPVSGGWPGSEPQGEALGFT